MNAEAIMIVSTAVVALVQLVKWGGLPDRFGPIAVAVLALVGVGIWVIDHWQRGLPPVFAFDYFAGWILVATSAAGVFGFTRASASAVTKMRGTGDGTIAGAGSSYTKE